MVKNCGRRFAANDNGGSGNHYNILTIFQEVDGALGINAGDETTENSNSKEDADSWSSQHPGGAQFVRCDGSVSFVTETIDDTTFANFCNRQDGKPLGNF